MASQLEALRKQREEARAAADLILTRAQEEGRDITTEESADYQARILESREADSAIEEELVKEIAEVRAQATRTPEVETRTLGDVVLERGWNLKTKPSVTISGDDLVQTRAQSLPAVASWNRLPGVTVPLGQDRRFLYPSLNTQSVGEASSVLDFKQSARTLTGTVQRNLNSVASKATLDVTVAAVTEDLTQFAVVLPAIPNQVLESVPAFTDFMNGEGAFQVSKAIDAHVLAQIVAGAPAFSNTGTSQIDKIRNQIGSMRALGANPTILALQPSDSATLDLFADAGGYKFPLRDTGSASPIFGCSVVEWSGTAPMYLIDPATLGVLYMGSLRVDADPYTGFAANTTSLRVEVNALFHIRNIQGAYRIAAT